MVFKKLWRMRAYKRGYRKRSYVIERKAEIGIQEVVLSRFEGAGGEISGFVWRAENRKM